MDLALDNLQRLICHKTKQTNKPNLTQKWFLIYTSLLHEKHISRVCNYQNTAFPMMLLKSHLLRMFVFVLFI